MTITMPPSVTANSGFDALCHALECYVLTNPSDLVDSLALWSARTVCEWLPKAVADGKNIEARDRMHTASLQAGQAFTNGSLGLVHMLAHILGAEYHIPHGRAIAFVICPVFVYFYSTRRERLVDLAKSLGLRSADDATTVQALIDFLNKLKQEVGIPLSIKDSALPKDLFVTGLKTQLEGFQTRLSVLPPMVRSMLGVPDSMEEVRTIFDHAWNGTTADLTVR